MLKVSVIIPSYNHARFLEQRIESVLNQTFQDFEIIFLDDASTDNSKEVFSKYVNHAKISHTIFNEINSGSTFKQWNKGFNLAAGEYVWIAESDDYASPQFLEKLVPVLDGNHNVGLAYCQSCLVDEQDKLISPNFLSCTDCLDLKRWTTNYVNEGKNECSNFLAATNTIPNASAVLIRKAIYESEVGRENEIFKVAGDKFTWSKILLASDVYFISESLNYHRFSQGSVSRNHSKNGLIVLESLKIFLYINEKITISKKAQEIFFDTISNWWFGYLVMEKIVWKREVSSYQQIISLLPNYSSLFFFHCQLLVTMLKRFRYLMKLKTRVKMGKKHLECTFSNLITFWK